MHEQRRDTKQGNNVGVECNVWCGLPRLPYMPYGLHHKHPLSLWVDVKGIEVVLARMQKVPFSVYDITHRETLVGGV